MKPTTLGQIAAWCGGTVDKAMENVVVTGLCHDSREVEAGDLFFALQGTADGHDYVAAAKAAGAAAALCSHPVDVVLPVVLAEDTPQGPDGHRRRLPGDAALYHRGHHRQRGKDHHPHHDLRPAVSEIPDLRHREEL